MKTRVLIPSIGVPVALTAASVLYGCTSATDSTTLRPLADDQSPPPPARAAAGSNGSMIITPLKSDPASPTGSQAPAATVIDARPAAMLDGRSITWGELRPILNDLAGAQALREYVLDQKISRAVQDAGITITADDLAAERKILLESLSDDPNTAIRLLDELRARQNLGRARFEAQLRRNAGLRAMVKGEVKITDDAIRSMHDLVHGPRRQARLMLLPDLSTAQDAINLVNSGVSFADVAVEMSTDVSAARGGLLEPISLSNPNYPEALRQTIFSLNTGQMSGPVLVNDKYAVVLLTKRMAADGTTIDDARPALERLVRLSQERLLMDQLMRRIVLDSAVTVFDEELNESWRRAQTAP
jgi:parvulin-like peptidyl-prolyl isomerase